MFENSEPNPGQSNIILDTIRLLYLVPLALLKSCVVNILAVFWFLPGRHKDIRNDIILITGGGKGIGRLLAVGLAKHNPKRILLWGRHQDTLLATSNIIRKLNVPCDYMICDVSDRLQVQQKAQQVFEEYGGVTVLINNAGVVFGNTILASNPDEIQQTFNVNVVSHFWMIQAFLPYMIRHNHGHVVSISSTLGLLGLAGAADYSASKFAATGFTEALRMEVDQEGATGVHITSVHPYMIDNEMFAGCTTRFPRLFPPLDPHYVAWKIVDSVLSNHDFVILPRMMYLGYLAKCILPSSVVLALYRFCGLDRTMDNFHGRVNKKTS